MSGYWGEKIAEDKYGLSKVTLIDDDNSRSVIEVGVNGCAAYLSRDEAQELISKLESWLSVPPPNADGRR